MLLQLVQGVVAALEYQHIKGDIVLLCHMVQLLKERLGKADGPGHIGIGIPVVNLKHCSTTFGYSKV